MFSYPYEMQQMLSTDLPQWHVTDRAFSNSYKVTTMNFSEPTQAQRELDGELWCEDQLEYARQQFVTRFVSNGTLQRQNVKMYVSVKYYANDGETFHVNSGKAQVINSIDDLNGAFGKNNPQNSRA